MAKLTSENVGTIVSVPPNFRDRVTMRVKEASFGESKSSGNLMITLKCEIIAPDKIDHADAKSYILAGQEITYYLGLSTELKGKARQSPWATTFNFLQKLGLPTELDTEEMETTEGGEERLAYLKNFDNLTFDAILSSNEKIAQKKVGNEYVAILDGRGKPQSQGYQWSNNLGDVVGVGSVEGSAGPN